MDTNKYRRWIAAVVFCLSSTAFGSTIVWDQGPSTGSFGGEWTNITGGQNFADSVMFGTNTMVNGFNLFTNNQNAASHTGDSDFNLKIYSDQGGVPDSIIYTTDLGYSDVTYDVADPNLDMYAFAFDDFNFLAGITYWIGIAGNSNDPTYMGQATVNSSQDGILAGFASSYSQMFYGIGDQMFQLTYTEQVDSNNLSPVPLPAAAWLFGSALLGFAGFNRFRQIRI